MTSSLQRRWRRFCYFQAHRLLRPWLSQPLGHFYSPIGDIDALAAERSRLWSHDARCAGIDFQREAQTRLVRDVFPLLLQAFDYPDHAVDAGSYHLQNSQFSQADARALFALLRHWRPRRMVEVGSGYSTLLAADINRRFLDNALHLTAIEPFPRSFLHDLPGLQSLRIERVQDTPAQVFAALESGDVLFIDSSHVLKTGSDLVHLLTQVLPCLASGVHVHFHDLFLPDDYPPQWVIDENRSWNEQYAVQAILASNPRYRVVYGTQYALTRLSDVAHAAFGSLAGQPYAGGSFWIDVQ
ncbi:MAG: class I SAM-dependent methyltransferase [Luteimonas sp.]